MQKSIVIAGAGIVGVSTGIWLRRISDADVTIIDRLPPGEGTSHGNAGVLASCSIAPVTAPGLIPKAPRMLLNPNFPLFMRLGYFPKLVPWLLKYLSNANDSDTRRIAKGLTTIVGDSVDQHKALAADTDARQWVQDSNYSFAYANRAAFEADAYTWALRREAGFEPEIREGETAHVFEPSLSPDVGLLATMKDHGYIRDPGGYVKALAKEFEKLGGKVRQAEINDFDLTDGKVTAVQTDQGPYLCDQAILATGVWSKPLMQKLGLTIPIEAERGYHIVFRDAEGGPSHPVMIASGKFVATPMTAGLRCAGIVEFGGLAAGPSQQPLDFLRRHAKANFPNLTYSEEVEWLGHRPAPSDSLPLIGQVGETGVFTAFGHHHIGLTGGPKTGRITAGLVAEQPVNTDISAFNPMRFS
ncbi:dehydrogenase [Tateyamaria omphalii]|uniref:NAD(P)/FAD-dependent oxidoreductase n=1 Tax=Tateyamaria omphalii TaxID=299262 RepID=UPI00167C0D98|nr:FAD-dependent oxidoreductase [Tateyamaria omphalii]GGX59750.1 dehydrogenase [Tateyamaria omphalii]